MSGALAIVALVLVCATGALAQQKCPSTVCDSYFGNAMGGPIDCCYWDYSKNPKCVWGGTPVSWTKPGTCVENGKTYSVLYKGNFQGAPTKDYCRCKEGTAAPPLANVNVCATLKPKPGFHIVGADIGCDNLIYCKKCGGVDSVAKACGEFAKCAAIVMEDSSGCGYLKSAGGPLEAKGGFTAYVRE